MQAIEDLGLQRLRDSANAALSQVEPVMLVLASVVTWIVLSLTNSVLSGAYISVSEKGEFGLSLESQAFGGDGGGVFIFSFSPNGSRTAEFHDRMFRF